MRRTIKLLTLTAALAVFAMPVFAQTKECNDENKAAWYQTFLANFRGEVPQQKIAYDAAKAYLDSCPADPNDQQATYMRDKFVVPYEKIHKDADVATQFEKAVKDKNYPEELRIGKQLLVNNPDNTAIYIIIGQAGLGNEALLSESAEYAKKAIEMIEAGKPFAPAASKDQALAYLKYAVGRAKLKSAPNEAVEYLVKAAKYDSALKQNPQLYLDLANAYGEGPVTKYHDDYNQYIGKDESTESKLVKANLNQAIDRQIDAFARAVALNSDPAGKKAVMDVLAAVYKDRIGSEAGLPELIAGITSKPLPDAPTPITTLPAASTTTGGTSTNGGSTAQQGTNGGGAKPAGTTTTTPATGTQTGKTPPKPVATPTPKPRRSNHRRG